MPSVPGPSHAPIAVAPAEEIVTSRVFHSFEALESESARWDETVLATGSTVYMTFDWIRTWWRFYGRDSRLLLFVFERGKEWVAVVPIYVETLGYGPLRLRVARLVGANIPPKVFDPPISADTAGRVFDGLLQHLFGEDLCDHLGFGPFSELHAASDELLAAASRFGDGALASSVSEDDVHTVFKLPADMEAYFAGLSKNERKNRRKYELRTLEKEYRVGEDCISDPKQVAAEFDAFEVQHALQWRVQGKPGHFGSWPGAKEYNRAQVEAQARRGRVRFLRILADDRVVSRQYVFAWGPSYFWELPSREVGDPWEKFSLGPSGIVRMLAHAIGAGYARVEGGLAHYDYKLRLGATEHKVRTIRVFRNGSADRLRVATWSLLRSVVRLLYHKIWYRRIQPRLPLRMRYPQPFFWLRLDF